MKVTHYYAGCRVDDVPVITENRITDTDAPTVRPMIRNRRTIKAFCDLLVKYGLLGDFVMRYAKNDNEFTLKEYFERVTPEHWPIVGITWIDNVHDYLYLSLEWGDICKKN